ncbi:MAG: pyridoxine 5'-phosphate synthase [Candidatus Omnitrophota bacterium]
MSRVKLGVNIDHVATLRQARGEEYPDPADAIEICESAGADSIVCHLREDRRHINDRDVLRIQKRVTTRLNLEMSLAPEIVKIACRIKPDEATLVPERRQEITTEGGLDVVKYFQKTRRAVDALKQKGVEVSLFIDPAKKQIRTSAETGVTMIELHTGRYASARTAQRRKQELKKLREAAAYAQGLGLTVNAGHGLTLANTAPIAAIPNMTELNIGHSIIADAVFVGLKKAVRNMRKVIREA